MNPPKIRLHQYPPAFGLSSLSPFCIKVEAYLRFAAIPFETREENNPLRGPRGRMPFIEYGSTRLADSDQILEYLESRMESRNAPGIDAWLSPSQKATVLFLRRMLDEDLYRVILYSRWVDPRGWEVLKKEFRPHFPWGLRTICLRAIRMSLTREARGRAILEHPAEELYSLGERQLQALRDFLGEKPYLFGERPTTADATAYAFLSTILKTPIPVPLRKAIQGHPPLLDYCARIENTYFNSKQTV